MDGFDAADLSVWEAAQMSGEYLQAAFDTNIFDPLMQWRHTMEVAHRVYFGNLFLGGRWNVFPLGATWQGIKDQNVAICRG